MLFLSKETLHNLGWTLHLRSLSKASLPLRDGAVNGLGPSVSLFVVSFGVLFWIGFFFGQNQTNEKCFSFQFLWLHWSVQNLISLLAMVTKLVGWRAAHESLTFSLRKKVHSFRPVRTKRLITSLIFRTHLKAAETGAVTRALGFGSLTATLELDATDRHERNCCREDLWSHYPWELSNFLLLCIPSMVIMIVL